MSVVLIRDGARDGIRHEYWTKLGMHIVKLDGEIIRECKSRKQARNYIRALIARANAAQAQKLDQELP